MKPSGNVIDHVVSKDRCIGCGVCAGVCPRSALNMAFGLNGDLVPSLTGQCGERCGICLEVCPFIEGVHDPRKLNVDRYGPNDVATGDEGLFPVEAQGPEFHEDAGWYDRCLVGYSDAHRATSASGGLLTLCLELILASGAVDRVAVVRATPPASGRLFAFAAISNVEELRSCSGSVYYPVEISGLIREMMAQPELRWVVVGVPCMCTALRKVMRTLPKLERSIVYVMGLACGMYQNRMYTELLARASGVAPNHVKSVRYRVKSQGESASNYGFVAEAMDGTSGKVVPYQGLPLRLGRNGYFRCNACNFCTDVFAENADACFMDAWLPEYMSESCGTSLVIARSKSMSRHLEGLIASGKASAQEIDIEQVILSQRGQVRRKRRLIAMRLNDGAPLMNQSTIRDRFEWWLQRRIQQRSRLAWANYGNPHGLIAFHAAMLHLILIQQSCSLVMKTLRISFRWRTTCPSNGRDR